MDPGREDQVLRPDGQPGIYGVVEFKNRAVGVLPVDDEGCIWLVGQHRYPLNSYSWEIPEGGSPQSESPEETARRELKEETGLSAGTLELISTAHLSNSVCDEIAYIYRARGSRTGKACPREPNGCTPSGRRGMKCGPCFREVRSPIPSPWWPCCTRQCGGWKGTQEGVRVERKPASVRVGDGSVEALGAGTAVGSVAEFRGRGVATCKEVGGRVAVDCSSRERGLAAKEPRWGNACQGKRSGRREMGMSLDVAPGDAIARAQVGDQSLGRGNLPGRGSFLVQVADEADSNAVLVNLGVLGIAAVHSMLLIDPRWATSI